MDTVYSLFLLVSLIAGSLGAIIFTLVTTLPERAGKFQSRVATAALICGVAALLAGIISVSVHLVFGHGQGSIAPMTTSQYFGHHKAYWFVLLFTSLSFGAWRYAGRHQDHDRLTN
jgi:H+/Cl- antiporter ClcA